MTEKRVNEYQVIFKQLKNNKGAAIDQPAIEFLFQNHDDVSNIITLLSERNLFKDADQLAQFVIGLKLLGDVIMKNRDMELFSEIQPAFVAFMKKLKGK